MLLDNVETCQHVMAEEKELFLRRVSSKLEILEKYKDLVLIIIFDKLSDLGKFWHLDCIGYGCPDQFHAY